MADIDVDAISGSGDFIDGVFSGGLSHLLSSATPLTITPSAGKRIKLEVLVSGGGGGGLAVVQNVTISIGGVLFVDNKNLSAVNPNAGNFMIHSGLGSASTSRSSSGLRPPVAAGNDEQIVISTTEVLANEIRYSFTESR